MRWWENWECLSNIFIVVMDVVLLYVNLKWLNKKIIDCYFLLFIWDVVIIFDLLMLILFKLINIFVFYLELVNRKGIIFLIFLKFLIDVLNKYIY